MLYNSYQFLVQIPLGTTELSLTLLITEGLEVVSHSKPTKKPQQSSCYGGIHQVKMLSLENVFSLLLLFFRFSRTNHLGETSLQR